MLRLIRDVALIPPVSHSLTLFEKTFLGESPSHNFLSPALTAPALYPLHTYTELCLLMYPLFRLSQFRLNSMSIKQIFLTYKSEFFCFREVSISTDAVHLKMKSYLVLSTSCHLNFFSQHQKFPNISGIILKVCSRLITLSSSNCLLQEF